MLTEAPNPIVTPSYARRVPVRSTLSHKPRYVPLLASLALVFLPYTTPPRTNEPRAPAKVPDSRGLYAAGVRSRLSSKLRSYQQHQLPLPDAAALDAACRNRGHALCDPEHFETLGWGFSSRTRPQDLMPQHSGTWIQCVRYARLLHDRKTFAPCALSRRCDLLYILLHKSANACEACSIFCLTQNST